MRTLTLNIKREFFAAILAIPRRKEVEYRDLTEYWTARLENAGEAPFRMRMLNGMTPPVPEATVIVERVHVDRRTRTIEFHLGKVLEVKGWDRRKECPVR